MSTSRLIVTGRIAVAILSLLLMSPPVVGDQLSVKCASAVETPPAPAVNEDLPAVRYLIHLSKAGLPAHVLMYMRQMAEHDLTAYVKVAPAAIVGLSRTGEVVTSLQIADSAISIELRDAADVALQPLVDAVVASLWQRGEFQRLLSWGQSHAFFMGHEQYGLDTSHLLLGAALGQVRAGRLQEALLLVDRADAVGGRLSADEIADVREIISATIPQGQGSLLKADRSLLTLRATRLQYYVFGLIALLTAIYHIWRHAWPLRRQRHNITALMLSDNDIPPAGSAWNPFRPLLEAIALPIPISLIIMFELLLAGHWLITRTAGLGDEAIWYGVILGAVAIPFEIWLLFQLERVHDYIRSRAIEVVQMPSERLHEWLDWHKAIAFDRRAMMATGISALFAALLSAQVMTNGFTQPIFWFLSPAGKLYGYFLWAGSTAIGGLYFAVLLETTIMLASIGRLPLNIRLLDRAQKGVSVIGRAALHTAFWAGILGSVYAALALAPPQGDILGGVTYAWLVADVLVVGFVFFYPQMSIHELLVSQKQEYLGALESATEDRLCQMSPEECDMRSIDNTSTLATLTESVNRLSTWPFDARSLATVAATVVVPVLVAIIELTT